MREVNGVDLPEVPGGLRRCWGAAGPEVALRWGEGQNDVPEEGDGGGGEGGEHCGEVVVAEDEPRGGEEGLERGKAGVAVGEEESGREDAAGAAWGERGMQAEAAAGARSEGW